MKGGRGKQEEFYVEENVEKAIKIDDYQAEALTTSMVDDVFYILQKSGQRALSSGNLQCACAILGQLNNLLASNLRQALDSRWKARAPPLARSPLEGAFHVHSTTACLFVCLFHFCVGVYTARLVLGVRRMGSVIMTLPGGGVQCWVSCGGEVLCEAGLVARPPRKPAVKKGL